LIQKGSGPALSRKADSLKPAGDLSLLGVVFALACTSLGAGLVAVPRALSLAGCAVGLAILFTLAGLNALSLHCLFKCARTDPSCSSYQALARKHLPKKVSLLIEVAIALLLMGATGTTFLLSTHVLGSAQLAVGHTFLSEDFLSLVLFLAVLPICLARNFAALQWVNMVNFSCVLCVVVVICCTSVKVIGGRKSGMQPLLSTNLLAPGFSATTSLGGALAAVPIMLYIFFNQILVPELFAELRKEARPLASAAGGAATVACASLYVTVGLLGYACFGSATGSDILAQLGAHDSGDVHLLIGQALFGLVLLCSMPLIMAPLRGMILTRCIGHARVEEVPFQMHFVVTAAILVTAGVIARTVPWVDLLMGIMGATSVAFLALTIPGALTIRCFQNTSDQLAGYVLLFAGILCTPLTLAALIVKPM